MSEPTPPAVRVPPAALVLPVVPGYRVHRLLGSGGSGRVWAATAPDGEDVAVKVLSGAPGAAASLATELDLAEGLQHPHVVRVREVVATPTGPALVLDRAHGGSLAALVGARGPLEPAEVITLLCALAGALGELHARGLVHGDVTPGNVLFAADARPLLADWGSATVVGLGLPAATPPAPTSPAPAPQHPAPPGRRARRAAPPGAPGVPAVPARSPAVVGATPGYTDPAVLAGGRPGPTGDVHGLASVGWFALTGAAPPPAAERPPLSILVPGVPPALSAALAAALDVDPAARPDAAALARDAWAAGPAEPVHLVPSDPTAPAEEVITHRLRVAAAQAQQAEQPRAHPRRRRWSLLAAALALALGAAGGTLLVRRLDAPGHRPASAAAGPSAAHSQTPPVTPSTTSPATPGAVVPPAPSSSRPETPAPDPLTGADPVAAVPALAALRARAFTAADAALLDQVDGAGSAPAAVDGATVRELAGTGASLQGLSFGVRSARLVDRAGDQAWVRVRVVTSAHRLVRGGAVVAEVPASAPVTSLLLLTRQGGRWRVTGTA